MPRITKKTVLLLCGGRSTEHKVPLISCLSVFNAIDRTRFRPLVVGIDETGTWRFYGDKEFLENANDPKAVALLSKGVPCSPMRTPEGSVLAFPDGKHKPVPFDVAFPVMHGANGEDGTIQGLFEMLGVPYVGCDVNSSSNCMDKERTKILASDLLDIPVAAFYAFGPDENIDSEMLRKDLGLPLFIKPAHAGSSVGISRVKTIAELDGALEEAFRYDDKVLVEEAVLNAREIECAVLELPDGNVFVADPGEVIPKNGFYDYNAKYIDEDGARLQVPAVLPKNTKEMIREAASMVFDALGCGGMARVDFFYQDPKKGARKENLILNEVNTIPGFTNISLYPKMMENSGIKYPDLITTLLETAMTRFQKKQNLKSI